MKIEKWRLYTFLGFVLYFMIAMYGTGIQRGEEKNTYYIRLLETHREASNYLIDKLMIESGREPMFNTRQKLQDSTRNYLEKDLFRKENQHNG